MATNERSQNGLTSSPSSASRSSTISHLSGSRPGISPIHSPGGLPMDSSQIGRSSPQPQPRVVSDISAISETERGHLRGISETSVSTDGGLYGTPMEYSNMMSANLGPRGPQPTTSFDLDRGTLRREGEVISPLTPPEGVEESGGDYLGRATARAANPDSPQSPTQRRSNFEERL